MEENEGRLRVSLGDGWRVLELRRLGTSPRFALSVGDRTLDVLARDAGDRVEVVIAGVTYVVETVRPRKGRGRDDDDEHFHDDLWTLVAPITGSVVEIRVSVSDVVEPGTILMVVEAMKMQNELRSRVAGTVTAIHVKKGQRVETGRALLEVTAPPA